MQEERSILQGHGITSDMLSDFPACFHIFIFRLIPTQISFVLPQ